MWKKPAGNLGLRGAVEGPVVGEYVDPDPEDPAVPGRGDLALHVVVAGERGGHQVLAPVLDPLDRLPGEDRADHREHVAGVDADLVAEAAADVRGDDLDVVLGDPGDQRVDRAVRVRRLVGRPDREPAGHPVHAGDGAAGLHRRRVHARVEHLLGDHHVGGGEHLVRERLVAGLPVEDVVVGAPLDVVADHRRVRVERLAGVHDGRQVVVLDVDQLERVPGGVLVLGDDHRHLLALEAHLVGGEDGLHVGAQRRHPGEVERLEGGPGDDRPHLRVRLRLAGVDRHDPGVRDGAAQDRGVQHAGDDEVVEVVPLATQEAGVLLAEHPAEADRVARRAGGGRGGVLGAGHAWTSWEASCAVVGSAGCRAAQRTARTMFS